MTDTLQKAIVGAFKEAMPGQVIAAAFKEALPLSVMSKSFVEGTNLFLSPFVGFARSFLSIRYRAAHDQSSGANIAGERQDIPEQQPVEAENRYFEIEGVIIKGRGEAFPGVHMTSRRTAEAVIKSGFTSADVQSADVPHDEPEVAEVHAALRRLTPREREVMTLAIEGHSLKDISQRLALSAKTVAAYRAAILRKLLLGL
ncbi:MAG TPA: helix-turn-helix transcriptional regulator [Xanthobacteraceae bacterium]|nr:helix-turn-helix transcriptional regulator [Xanthobacteraceae bacterium]